MYFDHVRCPSCNVQFNPERISSRGDAMSCPSCGAQLSLKSLFGLAAHLTEEDETNVTLDDLVPGLHAHTTPPAKPRARQEGQPLSALDVLDELKRNR